MQLVAILLLVVGAFMVMQGIYEEKLTALKENVKVEYRFVPRSYYEEQMFDSQFKEKMAPIFQEDDQWYHRNTGRSMGIDRKKI